MATSTKDAVLNVRGAAKLLKLTGKAVLKLAEGGRLPGRRIEGEDWRFSRAAILAWLAGYDRARAAPPFPVGGLSDETPEEFEAFMATIRAHRDEVDRATGSGKYAPE